MAKTKFTAEFEIRASKKMLYPYLHSASGLSQWFADDVNINEDKEFIFQWDGKEHVAKPVSQRTNHHVKFEFQSDNGEDEDDLPFLEFRLDQNELTQSVFLKVTDYSDTGDEEELEDLWEGLVGSLKEIVGG
ncbi:MAG: START-like domain-containing protein [Cyclobacteriaceae bacterium]